MSPSASNSSVLAQRGGEMKMMLLQILCVLYLFFTPCPVLSLRQPSDDYWGDYGPYGECSRTCGTGVAMRTRTCITQRADGGHNCFGPSRSYRTCNTQECPSGARDFREEQCSRFDRMDFQGKHYTWLPYYGAANPCELVCVPRGENFYYRHRQNVVDGTPCYVGRSDICVEGICRTVSHGEIVGVDFTPTHFSGPAPEARALESYRYRPGVFSECSAPCGGGVQTRSVECVSEASAGPRVVEEHYCRNQGLNRPPTQQPCNIHHCAEYSVSSYSECSATCGEGTQRREVFCVGSRGERLPDSSCGDLPRPQEVKICRKPACQDQLQYHVGDWSLCSLSCGSGRREREVICMDFDQNRYGDERCSTETQPPAVERCNMQPCPGAQMVPSVHDPRGHESTLRGFVPHQHEGTTDQRTYYGPTPVIGPHCAQSRFGCCPDGHTSASGPGGLGCQPDDCVRTRYGCCLDGVTAAQGFGRAGCPDFGPSVLHSVSGNRETQAVVGSDACFQPRAPGSCYDWVSRFFYDSSLRRCSHFWYGGCEGNDNNFPSMEACQRQCERDPASRPVRRIATRVRVARVRSYQSHQ
ncbi:papilin-like isoform X1 [Denticeps clupeoides]|uniref:papilin-like isoform X1 n=1 Tax=Denticeps clupeoides TaxID=299321 RepID=UPI0010A2D079|nr:papilin-like isoform X1 [Denticeps clupeoides]